MSVSAQGDNDDKACTTSDASSTILTRIAHRTLPRPADARSLYARPLSLPCPRSLTADCCEGTSPDHTHTHTHTGQGITDNDKRYLQCCTLPPRSDTLGLRAPPPASLAIASLRLHVNSIPPACCQRAVYDSPFSSWRCGDATCALYRQHSTRRPSSATYEVGCHSCRWPSEERRREDVAAVRKDYYNCSPLHLQEGASCTPLHASRGRRDVSGLVQLAAYHHETGVRSACTKRVNPSGLTAAGSTAHMHPDADNVFE